MARTEEASTQSSKAGLLRRLYSLVGPFLPVVIYVLSALKARARAKQLAVLQPSDGEAPGDFVVWSTPGVTVDDATRRAAVAHADEHGLDVIDLLPGEVHGDSLMELISRSHADGGGNRLQVGPIAGFAILVRKSLVEKSELPVPTDTPEIVRAARDLKRYGARIGVAVAPDLGFAREEPSIRGRLKQRYLLIAAPFAFVVELVLLLQPLGALKRSWLRGAVILAAFNLQPLIAASGTPFRIRSPLQTALFRNLIELWRWVLSVVTMKPDIPFTDADRERYAAELGDGPQTLLEPRRFNCPICESAALELAFRTHDVTLNKPGEFHMDRCHDCGHVFQNPRLSIAGLDYYYRDNYDGLNSDGMQLMYEADAGVYRRRAERLRPYATPKRWLDVGTGYGHFPFFAKEVWPETRFDGLDFGGAIHKSGKRGWVENAYYGLFPDVAPDLKSSYDVVSMLHYLEHTRDPRVDLKAAHEVLEPGGHLLIEIPNPDSPLGKMIGGQWYGWVQPQHQHMLNQANLERLFAETGFEPLQWYWGECHVPVNFIIALWPKLVRMSPGLNWPWLPKPNLVQRTVTRAIWLLSPLAFGLAGVLDYLTAPYFKSGRRSCFYGVLARRKEDGQSTAVTGSA